MDLTEILPSGPARYWECNAADNVGLSMRNSPNIRHSNELNSILPEEPLEASGGISSVLGPALIQRGFVFQNLQRNCTHVQHEIMEVA